MMGGDAEDAGYSDTQRLFGEPTMQLARSTCLIAAAAALAGGLAHSAKAQTCNQLTWSQVDNGGPPGGGSGCVMAFDSVRNRTVLFGGVINGARTNHTWEWDGQSWVQRPTLGGIPGLWAAAGAFDSQRGRLVVCSGGTWSGAYNEDTWEYDGERWAKMATTGPGFRNYMWQMAYDSQRGRTVLFGGSNPSNTAFFGDTWEWDGVTWVQVATAGPAPRSSHGMAFDASRGRIVMHGGGNATTTFGDTWEWNGVAWELRATTGPAPSGYMRLAYDAERQRVIACGANIQAANPPFEFWEWDGSQWTPREMTPEPQARSLHNLAFDSLRNRLVLFGGFNGLTNIQDTWELDLTNQPPQVLSAPESQGVRAGNGPVTFMIEVAGDTPMSYRWTRDGAPVANSPRIQGATTPVLSISQVELGDAGVYQCEVSNACGSDTSRQAVLAVFAACDPDFNQDGNTDQDDVVALINLIAGRECP